MVTKYLIIWYVLVLIPFLYPQEQEQLKNKKSELVRLKDEISSLQKELNSKSLKEKESFNTLENYNKQNFLLNKLIARLKEEEQLKQQNIESTHLSIQQIEKEIDVLKKNYAKYVIAIYKHGRPAEFEYIINAGSVDKAILRYKYLQKFAEKRKKDLDKYVTDKQQLITLKEKLQFEKSEKEKLGRQKEEEESALKKKVVEKKELLAGIRKDKVELKKEIDAKKSAQLKISAMINRLIEESIARKKEEERIAKLKLERIKKLKKEKSETVTSTIKNNDKTTSTVTSEKESEKEEITEFKTDLSTANLSSFAALKGRMNWPVSSGKVIRQYGENLNTKLNTVTLNYGIDIKTGSEQSIKCVAEGIVSAIEWIPGYGSVIIISHKDEYRTVYSHLGQIYVKEGDRVKSGTVIASVGESLDGNVVHFEIWSSRNNQNPELWLTRK